MKITGIILLLILCLTCPASAVSWEFNSSGNTEGWWVGNAVTGLTTTGGCLVGNVTGGDPHIIGVPSSKIDATANRFIQIRMRVGMGNTAEIFWLTQAQNFWHPDRMVGFRFIADNEFHDYVVDMSANPNWQGQVDALRFDVTEADLGRFEIDYIRVLPAGYPVLEASKPAASDHFTFLGEQFEMSAKIRNTGASSASNVRATLSVSGQTVLTAQPQVVDTLAPGQEVTLTWQVRADDLRVSNVSLTVTPNSPGIATSSKSRLVVSRTRPLWPSAAPSTARAWTDAEGNAVIENSLVRMPFIKSSYGYAVGELYIRNGDSWNLAAASAPLSRAGFMRSNLTLGAVDFVPSSATAASTQAGATLSFTFSNLDIDNGRWDGQIVYTLGDSADNIKAQFSLACNATRRLTEWVGPSLRFGNRSTGAAKSQALFPGLEWLVGDEASSNTLEAHPPLNLRVVPHPYKVTVPLMAVSGNGDLVGILWNASQNWGGGNAYPSAKFSSPNWYEGERNHLMELFIPSIPSHVQENASGAGVTYLLSPGTQLSMECHYLARCGGEVLDAIDKWYSLFGVASLPGEAGILESGLDASRTSLLTQIWNSARKGWPAVSGWDAAPYTEYTADLLAHALSEQDPTVKSAMRSRANEAVNQAISWWGQAGLGVNGASYVSGYRLPYFAGYLNRLPEAMQAEANNNRNTQQPDGGWFVPSSAWSNPGTKEVGSCAQKAYFLLRHARVTGDEASKTAGLNALNYMNTFIVPRGAQVWEVPQHAPDVLAAAWAVGAYLEGYIITGNTEYLNESRYWARAGLPFVYAWKASNRAIMDYATIPVFGATHYIAPWFGVPVQWCGMAYAFYIDRLADYDDSMPWRTISEGITRSGIQQMRISVVPGYYPDAVTLVTNNEPSTLSVNPDIIYKNTLQLLGKWHEIDVRTITGPTKTARVSTAGRVASGCYNSIGNQLSIKVRYPASETCNILIFGVGSPTAVYKGNTALTKYSNVNSVSEGWSYHTTYSGYIVIKGVHISEEQTYHIMVGGLPAQVNETAVPAEAKQLSNGSIVALRGVVTAGTRDMGRDIYVQAEDRSSGIKVSLAADVVLHLERGDIVEVMGTMSTVSGERCISGADARKVGRSNVRSTTPLGLPTGAVGGDDGVGQAGITGGSGLNNVGLLVAGWGRVTRVGDSYLYVDDGSNLRDGTSTGGEANIGIRVICDPSGYEIGDYLDITGISSMFEVSTGDYARRILTRAPSDLRKHSEQ